MTDARLREALVEAEKAVSREAVAEAINEAEAAEDAEWEGDTKARVDFVVACIRADVHRAIAHITAALAGTADKGREG